jgi:crotonobetainyl-CoA:carnitine CoA-transferase CaiB-like acyl-CoA transferase
MVTFTGQSDSTVGSDRTSTVTVPVVGAHPESPTDNTTSAASDRAIGRGNRCMRTACRVWARSARVDSRTARVSIMSTPDAPLTGILVADFSRVLAGPLATMTLADLGARVIKVERPDVGDDTRSWGPPFSATGSTYFESVNRNKESVCLDLTDPHDLRLARELIARCDVVVENFKPGGMEKLGLGYDIARAANPGVVYASISGFGSAGGRELLGYDFVVQALGGLMSITGEADGAPVKAGVALVDVLTAKDAVAGILAALVHRQSTGTGARLELNLLSSLQGSLANQAQAYLGTGMVPGRLGNTHPSIAPYETLECSDGPIAVACGNDGQFGRLAAVLGAPQLADDPRFLDNSLRVANRVTLVPLLEERLRQRGAAEWQRRLTEVGVPAGRVGTIADGLELASSLGLAPTIEVFDSSGVAVARQVRHPITWNPPITRRNSAPPLLGEQDTAVREWLAKPVS